MREVVLITRYVRVGWLCFVGCYVGWLFLLVWFCWFGFVGWFCWLYFVRCLVAWVVVFVCCLAAFLCTSRRICVGKSELVMCCV